MSTTAPNTQLGKYQLVRHVASGEMTELWLGLDGERKVAIKRIREEFGEDKKYVQAFSEQARRASILHHDHIVCIEDVGTPTRECFYAMEWVEGIDLRAALAAAHVGEQQIRIEHVMTIMLATCEAFQYAHRKGVFHLDVSPANILIGFDGVVKVIDFGIATAVNRAKTRPGAQEGKVGYMSPELCLGKATDARSDIFSLGVVLYELLTVRRLFKAATDFLTMNTIIDGQIPKPSTVQPGIAPELETIVMKALATARESRYQTVTELRAALEKFSTTNKIAMSKESLADYARTLQKKEERSVAEPSEPPKESPGDDVPGVISGSVETPTKLRMKTAGGNDSTLIVRAITVSPTASHKKIAVIGIGAIAMIATVGIAIFVMQPSGEKSAARAEDPPAAKPAPTETDPPTPAVAQPAVDNQPAQEVVDEPAPVDDKRNDLDPPPPPPPDPEPVAKQPPPSERGTLVKLREPEPKPQPAATAEPPPAKKKKPTPKRPKARPTSRWDPNALFPEKK